MKNTNWNILEEVKDYKQQKYLNIDIDIYNIMKNRGFDSLEKMNKFLNPDIANISDPYLLQDMQKVVDKIILAINKKSNIWIYGDYDVDGITSTSLLYLYLQEFGANIHFYIPNRDDGYGLNKEALDYLASQKCNLIITVDCGISSGDEVDYCNSLGMEIIITDHHDINNKIPNAFAVINPKREDNKFPFKFLAGVGTAFMVVLALCQKLKLKEKSLDYLDIVAIGTIADVMPLESENRIFVKYGLQHLNNSKCPGLNLLIRTKYPNNWDTINFTSLDVGFIISPLLNAAGRLGNASKAVELFIEKNSSKVKKIIDELEEINKKRKEIQDFIKELALDKIKKEKLNAHNIIIVGDKNFHHGVNGIVASFLMEEYRKPVIIYEIKDNVAVASCRSPEAFDITDKLNKFSHLLLKYGGHAGAAGFSIAKDNIEKFTNEIYDYVDNNIDKNLLIENINIEGILPVHKISYDFLYKLNFLAPFGHKNNNPIFLIKNCTYKDLRLVGKNRDTIMMTIIYNNCEFKNCPWFKSGKYFEELSKLKKIDIACELKMEMFLNKYQYKILIKDIKESIDKNYQINKFAQLYYQKFPISAVFYTQKNVSLDKLSLLFKDKIVYIGQNHSVLGSLDDNIGKFLIYLKDNYNYAFKAECVKIEKTDYFNRVFISINKKTEFESYAVKDNILFRDIKNYLIGELFQYNYIQKKVLNSIFIEKHNSVAFLEKDRGVKTIIKTIGLYFKNKGQKALFVTKSEEFSHLTNFIDINHEIIDNYDFYIIDNFVENIIPKIEKNVLIITNNDNFLYPSSYNIIKDKYTVPKMLEIVDVSMEDSVFSESMPIFEKISFLGELSLGKKLKSTKDIIVYF